MFLPWLALVGGLGFGVPGGVLGLGRFDLPLVVQARCFSGFRV
jgi:hypothetical protein